MIRQQLVPASGSGGAEDRSRYLLLPISFSKLPPSGPERAETATVWLSVVKP